MPIFDRFLPCTRVVGLCLDRRRRLRPRGPDAGLRLGAGRRRRAALRVLDLLAGRRPGGDDDRASSSLPAGRPRGAGRRRDRRRPRATARSSTRCRMRSLAALGDAADARRAGDLGLHRRLRPRPRRPARRPPGDHPLGLGGGAGGPLPAGRGRPRRALRRRRRGDDLGRAQRRDRPLPCTSSARTSAPRPARPRRAPHGRRPHREGGQAQFIERPSAEARSARWSRPAAGRSSGSGSRSTSPRWPATPRSARAPSPAASARRPGRRRCSGCSPGACSRPAACSRRPTCRRGDRLARRLRHRRLAARPLPPRDLDQPDRLPAHLRLDAQVIAPAPDFDEPPRPDQAQRGGARSSCSTASGSRSSPASGRAAGRTRCRCGSCPARATRSGSGPTPSRRRSATSNATRGRRC